MADQSNLKHAAHAEVALWYHEARDYAKEGCRLCDGAGAKMVNRGVIKGQTVCGYWPCKAPGCVVNHFKELGMRVRIKNQVV